MSLPQRLSKTLCRGVRLYALRDDMCIVHIDSQYLEPALILLTKHNEFDFKALMDIICVDRLVGPRRFEISYSLLSIRYKYRLFLRIFVGHRQAIPSVTTLYKSADWLEREVWDMFGVFLKGHKDLRRILTDYGFEGHPMRKSFPLMGYMEIRYDDRDKRIVFEPISFMQEYRKFEFLRSWD